MLKAADFDVIDVGMTRLLDQFTISVLKSIIKKLVRADMTSSAAWQMRRLLEAGAVYDDVMKIVARSVGKTEAEIKMLFQSAGVKSLTFDDRIYRKAGLHPPPINLSPSMLNTLRVGIAKAHGVVHNLTMTTAITAQKTFLESLDLAYFQVSSGAFSYDQAIRHAVNKVLKTGVTVIDYESGKEDKVDVAIRRAVLTGVAQTTAKMSLQRATDMGCDLVQVSAHYGARNKGDIPENHEMWQGKVYSVSGTHPKYKDFREQTGYGKGEGLAGYNCRHSFYPFFDGASVNPYTEEELSQIEKKTVPYHGRDINQYEASQKQRYIERNIRKYKREAKLLGDLGLDNTEKIEKVREWQARMRAFVAETGLVRQPAREGPRVKLVRVSGQ